MDPDQQYEESLGAEVRAQLFNGAEAIGSLESSSVRGRDRMFIEVDLGPSDNVAVYSNDESGSPEMRFGRHIIRLEGIQSHAIRELFDGFGALLDELAGVDWEDIPDTMPGFDDEYDYAADDLAFDAARERSLR